MKKEPRRNTSIKKGVILISALLLLFLLLSALCIPWFNRLAEPDNQERLRAWISSLGFEGWLIFLGLQMLQVIVAFIPGEPVQLLAGVLYGTWGGLFVCLLGAVLASTLIFFTVRKAGDRLVVRLFGKNKLEEYAFLKDSERIETITFLLFLLPGMPKDLLTYLAGLTRIRPWKFLSIATLARVPALAASTLLGSSASRGNIEITLILVAVAVLAALVGVIYRERIMNLIRGHKKT